MQKIYF